MTLHRRFQEKGGKKRKRSHEVFYRHISITLFKSLANIFKVAFVDSYVFKHWMREWPMLRPGPEVIKLFLCSTQLSMKFQMLISIKISINSAFVRLR